MRSDLPKLLDRSDQLAAALRQLTYCELLPTTLREALAFGQARHCMELSDAQRLLLRAELDASAMSLVRVQFESTTRALWLSSAATDHQLQRYTSPTPSSELKSAHQGPSVDDMLKAMGDGPASHISAVLRVLKEATWRAMNHYSHASLIAVAQANHQPRDPYQLAGALLNANGMLMIAANVSMMSSRHLSTAVLRAVQEEFANCLPLTSGTAHTQAAT
ncbi:DUF6988 family protein [Roseateles flavus]|uniref:HDOD domain-containing protein n=1 Tax=Roseateles flavus TaxID=3149041 RepID=A0ABV0GKJ5_9BURK